MVGVGVSLARVSLWEEMGVPGDGDLRVGVADLRGEDVGVPGDLGGVEVGVCGVGACDR